MIIPGGLSSEASFKDAKFCVQTEFAQRPKPRVTTTISLNGQVVEKVENIWERLPQTEEDREEAEKFLKKQHQQVLGKIKEGREKLASPEWERQEMSTTVKDEFQKVKDELAKIEGVFGWIFVSQDGQMLTHQISEPEKKDAKDLVRRIKDIAFSLPSVARLENFVGGVLDSRRSSVIFLPLRTHFLAVKLDPKVDFKNLVKRIKSVI